MNIRLQAYILNEWEKERAALGGLLFAIAFCVTTSNGSIQV